MKLCGTLVLMLVVGVGATAAGLADSLYVAADAGVAVRKLNGPLRSQPQVFPTSAVVFRNGSSGTEWYGAVRVGVNVNDFLAIEGGYQDFGSTFVRMIPPPNVTFIATPPENFRFLDRAFTLDPVFIWKVSDRTKLRGFWVWPSIGQMRPWKIIHRCLLSERSSRRRAREPSNRGWERR